MIHVSKLPCYNLHWWRKIETRSVIIFLHLKGHSAQQIYDEMKAMSCDECLLYSTVTYWKRNFQTGHMPLTDELRSGLPSLTITGWYYSTLLNKLPDALKIKHPVCSPKVSVSLLTTHLLIYLKQHLWKQGNVAMKSCHTRPTLLILLQAVSFYSHRWKTPLKGRRFDDTDEVIQEVENWFSTQSEDCYNDGTHSINHRWEKCVTLDGD